MIALRWTVLIAVLVAAVARSQAELLDEGPYAELLVRHTESVGSTVGTRVDYAALLPRVPRGQPPPSRK